MIERTDFAIQQPVIINLKHLIVENLLEPFQIQNHAGNRIRIAFHRHLNHIVMTVAKRIRGRPVDALVLRIA